MDLNRSFPVGWEPILGSGWVLGSAGIECGTHAGIGTGDGCADGLCAGESGDRGDQLSFGSPGFYPAGEPLDPNSIALSKYLSNVTGYPYPPYFTGCYMTGSLVDWTLSTGAAGADVELSTHWDTEFDIHLNVVLALFAGRQRSNVKFAADKR